MKIFKVTIDNNPGGWKTSGEDHYELVIAKDKKEAIQKVIDGWSDKWDYISNETIITYLQNPPNKGYSSVRMDSQFSVSEIKFGDFDIHIKNPRQAKLDRIEKNIIKDNFAVDILKDELHEIHQYQYSEKDATDEKTYNQRVKSLEYAIKTLESEI